MHTKAQTENTKTVEQLLQDALKRAGGDFLWVLEDFIHREVRSDPKELEKFANFVGRRAWELQRESA